MFEQSCDDVTCDKEVQTRRNGTEVYVELLYCSTTVTLTTKLGWTSWHHHGC